MSDTIEVKGIVFNVSFDYDDISEYPWDCCDGRGPVRISNNPHRDGKSDKRPGEVPMNSPSRNEYQFYYDWQEAIKIAKRDGWNAQPYDAPNKAERAVKADFDYLRGFINGDWQYVTVTVENVETGESGESENVGMVETYKDYHLEYAKEIAESMADSAIKENEEADYWRCRDVETMARNSRPY
jgi:hypothetical protein